MNKIRSILFTFIFVLAYSSIAQTFPDQTKLSHPDFLTNNDFETLGSHLKGKRIVLAGEASHGGHEFFTIKKALFKYLVEKQGFKNFALEENFAVCEKLNAYITGRIKGKAKVIVKETYYDWPYHTEEFSDILLWMRDYNKNKSSSEMIRFWGFDMQFAYKSLIILNEKLGQKENGINISIPDLSVQQQFDYQVADTILAQFASAIKNLKSDNIDKNYLLRHLEVVKMQKAYSSKPRVKKEANALQDDCSYISTLAMHRYRDSCMATNVEWILSQIGKEGKMMVWAHNAHIIKSFHSTTRDAPMGAFLNAKFPNDIYAIGFDYDYGELLMGRKVIQVKPEKKHDFARLLEKEDYNLLFIPFTSANMHLVKEPVRMRRDHALLYEAPSELYDAIFFLKQVSASKPLK